MTDFSAHLLNSTKPFLTSNKQENHFTDKKPWNGDGERWEGGDAAGKTENGFLQWETDTLVES